MRDQICDYNGLLVKMNCLWLVEIHSKNTSWLFISFTNKSLQLVEGNRKKKSSPFGLVAGICAGSISKAGRMAGIQRRKATSPKSADSMLPKTEASSQRKAPCFLLPCWVTSVMSSSLQPYGLQPARFLCPWDFQARILEWVAGPSSRGPSPGIEPMSPATPEL